MQVIARAADVLRALENEPAGLSLSQIAARAGLARSTVQRLVSALSAEGFLAPVGPLGRVRLGPTLARLGAASRRDIRDVLAPIVHELAENVDETVDLAILDGATIRIVDQVPSNQELRAVSVTGAQLPLHSTANGKVLLSTLSDDELKRLLPARLPVFTPATLALRADLMRELEQIRDTGIAVARDEHTLGVSAVAALAHDVDGTAIAIAIPVPTVRFVEKEQTLIASLREACREATHALGASDGADEA